MTYDIHFNDENYSSSKGFELSLDDAKEYIRANNGTNNSYFANYKGGIVSVVSSDGETVYEEKIR